MSFRRFVNLVSRDSMKSVYSLRRINMSGLFLPRTTATITPCCQLPEPAAVNLCSSQLRSDSGDMAFHLLDNKVIATDTTGGALLYDPDKQAVRALPCHDWLQNNVVSHAVGNNLYIMDRLANGSRRCFEALVSTPSASLHGSWHWESLLPPPPPPGVQDAADDHTSIESFAAVDAEGSMIWVSATGSGEGCTHLYDVEMRAWSNPADWVLPFHGGGEYIPELNKLWFGISSWEHGCHLCASDLRCINNKKRRSQPPALLHTLVLEGPSAAADGYEYDLMSARAIYLGSGKFCVARFFGTPWRISTVEGKEMKLFAVMAGVEVTTSTDDGTLSFLERNSERYVLNADDYYWVL